MESIRTRLERAEDERLAPWALRSAGATRRHPLEDQGRAFDYRASFQRDRDRIVYSRAFRRLRHKAQAGILPAYEDHRRNRLTHTLEVAQVARTMARALALNEDLVEAIALAHDLGQPPFGPAGEAALDDLLSGRLDGRGGPGLGDLGGFWGSWQALRVVDELEKRYAHPGLNLTDAVREGILKAGPEERTPPEPLDGVRLGRPPLFEAQVVRLADRVASALHDLDDAIQARVVDVAHVERLQAVRALRRKLGPRYRERASRFTKATAIHRGLTHLLVTSAIVATGQSLARWAERHGVRDAEGFVRARDEAVTGREVRLNAAGLRLLEDLEGFLEARVRRRFESDRVEARGRRVVLGLFGGYYNEPSILDDHVLLRFKERAGVRYLRDAARGAEGGDVAKHYRRSPLFVRVLADHLASMTDTYALAEQAKLLEMGAIPIPSAEQLRREEEL